MNPFFKTIENFLSGYKFQHVLINEEKVSAVAKEWAKEEFILPNWREEVVWPDDDENYIQFLGITTAVNFCFKYPDFAKGEFSTIWRGKRWMGSFAMSACVMRAIEKGAPLLDAKFLSEIEIPVMRRVFAGDSAEIPLICRRLAIWREVGKVLLAKYGGHFKNLFEAAGYKCFNGGRGICERLVKDFPASFNDVRILDGGIIQFHKKALLMPLLYYGRAMDGGIDLPLIQDTEKISPVCDCALPKALAEKKMIVYAADLSRRINSLAEIFKDTRPETEIRLATAKVVAKLLSEINNERRNLSGRLIDMPYLDFRLWKEGRDSKNLHHITLTTDY